MTKNEFLKDYNFTFQIVKSDNEILIVITGVIERKSHRIVDTITTTIDIPSTNEWNKDDKSDKSKTEWNLNQFTDQIKRFQLDYFARRIGIDGYAPLDVKENPEIWGMYK